MCIACLQACQCVCVTASEFSSHSVYAGTPPDIIEILCAHDFKNTHKLSHVVTYLLGSLVHLSVVEPATASPLMFIVRTSTGCRFSSRSIAINEKKTITLVLYEKNGEPADYISHLRA